MLTPQNAPLIALAAAVAVAVYMLYRSLNSTRAELGALREALLQRDAAPRPVHAAPRAHPLDDEDDEDEDPDDPDA